MKTFLEDYVRVVAGAIGEDYRDNHDADRFGPEEAPSFSIKDSLRKCLAGLGLVSAGEARQTMESGLRFVEQHLAELGWLHQKLADEESKRILVLLAAYRALGHRKIRLPTNTPVFWKARDRAAQIPHGDEEIDPRFLGWKLHERSLENFGYPISMFTGPGACYTTFVHEQYRCVTGDGVIECGEGDIVVDAGGCYGDTALYFAHKAGPAGRVESFEFLPMNVSVFRRNLQLNPELAARIHLHECPVHSESGREMFVEECGPGTRVLDRPKDNAAIAVRTTRIDDLVTVDGLPGIDFIKMDIEGAELAALKGSEAVLREFKPKLAICVYHDFRDFWMIPRFIDSLGLGYKFYLRHFTIHAEETVLFASAGHAPDKARTADTPKP